MDEFPGLDNVDQDKMIEIIGAVLTALLTSSAFKKKKYCLWIMKLNPARWETPNPKGNSYRSCRQSSLIYQDHGVPFASMVIFPLGVLPPAIIKG